MKIDMNKIWVLLLLIIIYACSTNDTKNKGDIERIPIDVQSKPSELSSCIEKIEIVPLETNDSSLMGGIRKTMYDKDMDIYAIYDKKQIVHTFTGEGRFIGNSEKMRGKGPEQYYMAVDVKFNPYKKGIDLLNPSGTIYTYSPTFELISKRTFKPEFFFNFLMAISPDEYVFTVPSIWTGEEVTFANLKTEQSEVVSYSGTISSDNTMDRECFHKDGEKFYFIPKGINYYFYRIEQNKKKLIPIIYLDFGRSEIAEEGLPGVATGKRRGMANTNSDSEIDKLSKELRERGQYLRSFNCIIPLVKFFNDEYVYILFARGEELAGHYIYNRKKKEGYLITAFNMQSCFAIVDNVLLAISDAYYVPRLVETRLMSPKEIHKMEQLKEDDNPVILKYYLRK